MKNHELEEWLGDIATRVERLEDHASITAPAPAPAAPEGSDQEQPAAPQPDAGQPASETPAPEEQPADG